MLYKLVVGATLALELGVAAARGPFDVPYVPSEEVLAIPNIAGAWTEVYALKGNVQQALQVLSKGQTPDPIGVAASGKLHLSKNGKALVLEEASWTLTRDRAPLEYTDDCSVTPRTGDLFVFDYGQVGTERVMLEANVVEHYAFGRPTEFSNNSVRLDLSKPEHCQAVEESRLVLSGTLTFQSGFTKPHKVPVLVQYVVQQ